MLLGSHGQRAQPPSRTNLPSEASYVPEVTTPMRAPQSVSQFRKSLAYKEQFIVLCEQPMHGSVALLNRRSGLVERHKNRHVRPKPGRLERQHSDECIVKALFRMNCRNQTKTSHDLENISASVSIVKPYFVTMRREMDF
jgi:hypothetical protein